MKEFIKQLFKKLVTKPAFWISLVVGLAMVIMFINIQILQSRTNALLDEHKAIERKKNLQEFKAVVDALNIRLDSIKSERVIILSALDSMIVRDAKREAVITSLGNRFEKLKSQLNEKRPNYADSTIHAINNILPK
jgi:hypothetical protein